MAPIKICIDARYPDGPNSGARVVLIGLARALSNLSDGDEEFHFLVFRNSHQWLAPYIGGPCRLLPGPVVRRSAQLRRWKSTIKNVQPIYHLWRRLGHRIPRSDGTVERAGVHVMHFAGTRGFLTEIPSIYQPHDLQHLHYPQYFSRTVRFERELHYRAFCRQAEFVVMMSQWGREDIIRQYGLAGEKVRVVPWAPGVAAYLAPSAEDLNATRQKFSLPANFAFYPAQTWRHKNHLSLLEALAILRDRHDEVVNVVCSGQCNEFYATIASRARDLKIDGQVKFVGFVNDLELQCLYRLSRCLLFPTQFEGWGLPLMEAFYTSTPAACSNISPLKEQAAGAALLFDPGSPEQICEALLKLWKDEPLRQKLIVKGRERLSLFSWEHTARSFRALYRMLGHRQLTEEDRDLLARPALV